MEDAKENKSKKKRKRMKDLSEDEESQGDYVSSMYCQRFVPGVVPKGVLFHSEGIIIDNR